MIGRGVVGLTQPVQVFDPVSKTVEVILTLTNYFMYMY